MVESNIKIKEWICKRLNFIHISRVGTCSYNIYYMHFWLKAWIFSANHSIGSGYNKCFFYPLKLHFVFFWASPTNWKLANSADSMIKVPCIYHASKTIIPGLFTQICYWTCREINIYLIKIFLPEDIPILVIRFFCSLGHLTYDSE